VAEEREDRGKEPGPFWEMKPTYEEEGAFQAAVCTSALGDRRGAEAQYDGFMARYPSSVLVHAAVVRIARLHRGDIPKDAEALWSRAEKLQRSKAIAEEREAAMCGPECLAELLRREGRRADYHALADQMGTNGQGTTALAMADEARRLGFGMRGLMETQAGLAKQRLPAIALVSPGHFAIVDGVGESGVRLWDPDGAGFHKPAGRLVPAAEWSRMWGGVVVGR
ncbi:MAG TPA: cysteine peptidase family C39 domain-containing protein, partial [Chthonomonadales bacterium]|nr:cysteine peptidase family C39 domain-containing protein [Chthonomonadales bacterium]